jgi:hypothetical protein
MTSHNRKFRVRLTPAQLQQGAANIRAYVRTGAADAETSMKLGRLAAAYDARAVAAGRAH